MDQLVTASDLNTHVRDNLNALKNPPSAHYELDESSDYTTNQTSFVDVDATKLALTITTTGGDVMVGFHGALGVNNNLVVYFDVDVDGTREGGDDGMHATFIASSAQAIDAAAGFTHLIAGLSAGEHVFKLQWKVSANTVTLLAGAGTSAGNVHPQFWVREVS